MVFDYCVKYNGVFYPTGADVPVGVEPVAKTEEKNVVDNELTKEYIDKQNNIMRLRKIAKENNVAFENNVSIADLKEIIIKELGL